MVVEVEAMRCEGRCMSSEWRPDLNLTLMSRSAGIAAAISFAWAVESQGSIVTLPWTK